MRLFVDTSAFIALEDRSDRLHAQARAFYERLTVSDRLHSSNFVIDETITRLRYTVGHRAAVHFAEAILASRIFKLLYIDADLEAAALRVLRKFKDKKLSFTDCTSVAIVQQERLDGVFAFDEDFSAMGIRTLPRDEVS